LGVFIFSPGRKPFWQNNADNLQVLVGAGPDDPKVRFEMIGTDINSQMIRLTLACAVLVSVAGAAVAENETTFCRALRADRTANLGWPVQSDTIWYRGLDGKITDLGSSLPKRGVDQLFYYIRDEAQPAGQSSILNIKLVYRVPPRQARRRYVDLRNNKWAAYSPDRLNKLKSICGRVAPQEYELFHLQNTRSYCLQYFFHQTAKGDFNTIAFPGQRESFAFQDMLAETPGGSLGDFVASLFAPTKAKAAGINPSGSEANLSTVANSDVRSWITNYTYGDALGRCVAIEPNIPEDAQSLQLRVTNHRNYDLRTRTWTLDLSQ
jgi:hypothetical protein